ncbi:hypothetical protein [Candidatus Neptunochlamydia vexilliferae]|uniref:hypothetical protein n=1 Tax=Candidatus Neptunichlamydia vexilliferae TaxID=1651774 RepID=UPI0018915E21|nr:hypothetical protein [Candidatus Neptunochlamydia vexilliferae]
MKVLSPLTVMGSGLTRMEGLVILEYRGFLFGRDLFESSEVVFLEELELLEELEELELDNDEKEALEGIQMIFLSFKTGTSPIRM